MFGRKRVRRLMVGMGLEPMYQLPRTTVPTRLPLSGGRHGLVDTKSPALAIVKHHGDGLAWNDTSNPPAAAIGRTLRRRLCHRIANPVGPLGLHAIGLNVRGVQQHLRRNGRPAAQEAEGIVERRRIRMFTGIAADLRRGSSRTALKTEVDVQEG